MKLIPMKNQFLTLKNKTMYKKTQPSKGTLIGVKSYNGETIEEKVRRMVNNKEPIKDTGPLNFTDRKDGVRPEYNIRTDRMEIALDAMDVASKSHIAKRQQRIGETAYENMNKEQRQEFHKKFPKSKIQPPKEGDAGGESVQA